VFPACLVPPGFQSGLLCCCGDQILSQPFSLRVYLSELLEGKRKKKKAEMYRRPLSQCSTPRVNPAEESKWEVNRKEKKDKTKTTHIRFGWVWKMDGPESAARKTTCFLFVFSSIFN